MFFVLDALALMGSEIAWKLLVSLAGMLVGAALAYAATYPFRGRIRRSGVWGILGIFLGLASVFGIILAGSALFDIPAFPTAEGGNAGLLIYGLAFGFGVSVPRGLGFARGTGVPNEQRGSFRPEIRAATLVVATVSVLFALLFAAYVAIEYVIGPMIRYFAT